MTDQLINRTLGQYHLIEIIGRGGMATVYRAHQASLDRSVAVKVLQHYDNAEYIARFKAEARALALLQHPNILPVHDYGEQAGVLYLVLQYVPGGRSLASLSGPLPYQEVLELFQRLLAGLEYAHSKGIVHRDIKPANILLPARDWPMLADFGLSKLLSESGLHLTAPGTIMGTVAYMPPEQMLGQPIDVRSDIYSAGIVLYQLLTGRLPFEGSTPMEVLVKHAYAPAPPPRQFRPELPEALEQVVLRAMAKGPAARYQSAAAMATEIKRLGERAQARHDPLVTQRLPIEPVAATAVPPVSEPVAATTASPASGPGAVAARPSAPQPGAGPVVTSVPGPAAQAAPPRTHRWALPAAAVLILALAAGALALWPRGGRPTVAAPTVAAAVPTGAPTVAAAMPPTAPSAVGGAPPAAGTASGELVYSDAALWNDTATVAVHDLAPLDEGQVYVAWLSSASGSLALGILRPDQRGDLAVSYTSPSHQNLLGLYDRVYIAQVPESAALSEVANVVLAGGLPAEPLMHLRHALFSYSATPGQIGYLLGLRREAAEVLVHAERLAKDVERGNLASARNHAEHVVNIVEGQFGPDFGDLSKDGKVQNPGDGYGLLKYGGQEGYVEGVLHHVLVAAASPGAPPSLSGGAEGLKALGTALGERAARARDLALAVAAATDLATARQPTVDLLALAQGMARGEGSTEAIYQQTQRVARVALAPVSPGTVLDAPPPVQVVAEARPEVTISVTDDTYQPLKQTVVEGTTVVWKNEGGSAHTITADDGSFDSKTLAPGDSFSYTFTKAEAFSYYCTIHGGAHGEGMAGAVEVNK